jgi:hypothetical protein
MTPTSSIRTGPEVASRRVAVHRRVPDRRPGAGVIAYRDLDGELNGVNAWPATGPDLELSRRDAHRTGLDAGGHG